jgi:3-methyladenine DNA glycosylase AlkD
MKARSPSSSTPKKRSSRPRKPARQWTCRDCLARLRRLGSRKNLRGMARFGVRAKRAYGVAQPKMDALARRIGRDHRLAAGLWRSGVHDARILAGLVDQAERVTSAQMDRWVRDFDNWDVCDGTCGHLFSRSRFAWRKALEWSRRAAEFEKRAGFVLMAFLAVHDKRAADRKYLRLLPVIRRESDDPRNFVRKAVNWALRQIGKRNARLNRAAIREAQRIRGRGSAAARWIAGDALRELRSERVQGRLRRRA